MSFQTIYSINYDDTKIAKSCDDIKVNRNIK
jgi:hypothetical protein